MSGFHLDPDALRAVTDGLADAATTFDDAGQGVPTSADGGLAAGLVAVESSSALSNAPPPLAWTLAGVADRCNVDVATTDSEVAGDLLTGAP